MAKVTNFDIPVFIDKYIYCFNVSVDYFLTVNEIYTLQQLVYDSFVLKLTQRFQTLLCSCLKSGFEVLKNQVDNILIALWLDNVQQLNNVAASQLSLDLNFPNEHKNLQLSLLIIKRAYINSLDCHYITIS